MSDFKHQADPLKWIALAIMVLILPGLVDGLVGWKGWFEHNWMSYWRTAKTGVEASILSLTSYAPPPGVVEYVLFGLYFVRTALMVHSNNAERARAFVYGAYSKPLRHDDKRIFTVLSRRGDKGWGRVYEAGSRSFLLFSILFWPLSLAVLIRNYVKANPLLNKELSDAAAYKEWLEEQKREQSARLSEATNQDIVRDYDYLIQQLDNRSAAPVLEALAAAIAHATLLVLISSDALRQLGVA